MAISSRPVQHVGLAGCLSAFFASSPQKLLTFHAQFNKCLNKQKQILSGGKWHESFLARCFPPVPSPFGQADGFSLLRRGVLINYERFTSDNKDILKKSAIFPPQYETTPGWLQSHTWVKRNKRVSLRWETVKVTKQWWIRTGRSVLLLLCASVHTDGASANTEGKKKKHSWRICFRRQVTDSHSSAERAVGSSHRQWIIAVF